MRTLLKILFLCVLTVLLTMAAMAAPIRKDKDPDAKDKNLFVYKAERKLAGATVEILEADGTLVAQQVLQKRKVYIDFDSMKSGVYTIRVSRGSRVKEFTFEKK